MAIYWHKAAIISRGTAMRIIILCLTFLFSLPIFSAPETWTGKVVAVATGDRLTVTKGKDRVQLHLANIAAPSKGESGYKNSRASLASLCLHRKATVTADLSAAPPYDATVACNWRAQYYADMGLFQIEQGWAELSPSAVGVDMVRSQNVARAWCTGFWRSRMGAHCPPEGIGNDWTWTASVGKPGGSVPGGISAYNPDLISYRVTGTASKAGVAYNTPDKDVADLVALPFESDAYVFPDGQFIVIAAKGVEKNSEVTVEILLNGVSVASNSGTGTISVSCTRGNDC